MRALTLSLLMIATSAAAAPRRQLRVCADPNNLPYSNHAGEGLENAVARFVADALDADLTYTWQPQRRGFVRNTLSANRCDVMIEAPVGYDRAATTMPYYRSSYVFVARADHKLTGLRSFDDARLKSLRIGVQLVGDDYANPPPAQALGRRGLGKNVVGYPIYGDYSTAMPLAPVIEGVIKGDLDVAIVWGPLAGWLAQRSRVPLTVTPVEPVPLDGALPLAFDIGMGVRRKDNDLKAELDRLIHSHQRELTALLRKYGVPLLATEHH